MPPAGFSGPVTVTVGDRAPEDWERLLDADPGADFFHTVPWSSLAGSHHPHTQPLWLAARSGGRLVGGLAVLRRTRRRPPLGALDSLESSLEGTSGGPLTAGDLPPGRQAEVFRLLLERLLELKQGPLSRCAVSLNADHEARFGEILGRDPRWVRREVPAAVIDLQGGLEQVEMTVLKKNKRNERNRGLRRGLEVFVTGDPQWLDRYYPLYQAACGRWGQAPVPAAFLRGLLNLGPEHAFFTCVTLEQKVVGGHLNLVHGQRAIAWNGVTDPACARTHFPATVAIWGDIREACRRGIHRLDLGASGGVVSLEGFKQHFGAVMESRGFYVNATGGLKLLGGARSAARRLKSFLGPPERPRRWHDGRNGLGARDDSGPGDDNP